MQTKTLAMGCIAALASAILASPAGADGQDLAVGEEDRAGPDHGVAAGIPDQHRRHVPPVEDLPDAPAVDRGWKVADLPRDARDRIAGVRGERRDGANRAGHGERLHGDAVRRQQDDEAVRHVGRRRSRRRERPGHGPGAGAADAARGPAPARGRTGGGGPPAGTRPRAAEAAAGDHGRFSRSTWKNSSPTWPPKL